MDLFEVLDIRKAYTPDTAIKARDLAIIMGLHERTISKLGLRTIDQDVVSDKEYGFFIAKQIEHQVHNIRAVKSAMDKLQIRYDKLNRRICERMDEGYES